MAFERDAQKRRAPQLYVRPQNYHTLTMSVFPEGPGRRSFFKYAPPDTAIAVLKHRTIRYSSPLRFNDPFDVQSGLHFDFDLETLQEKVLDRITEYAVAAKAPEVDADDSWGKLVLLCRRQYSKTGLPKDRWRERLAPSFSRLVHDIRDTQTKVQSHWVEMLPGMRVFCVSEERDNLLMWAHYAKDHTGVVFELLSLPEYDNPLSVARRVEYVEQPPPFFTEEEWLADMLAVKRIDIKQLARRYVYYKSAHWQYEKEWRVWYPLIPAPPTEYVDTPLTDVEFPALYIGCKASEPFVAHAVQLARSAFPAVRIYRAKSRRDAYSLEYTEV